MARGKQRASALVASPRIRARVPAPPVLQAPDSDCDCPGSLREAALIEHHFDLVAEFTEDGRFVWVSPGYSRILGYTPDELIGRDGWENVHPEDLLRVPDLGILRDGRATPHVVRLRHRDGSWRSFEGVAVDYRTAEGEPRRIGIARDITEEQRLQEQLRRSEERYRRLAENGGALVCEIDAQGKVLYVNRRYQEVLGLSSEALVGKNAWHLIREEDLPFLKAGFREAVRAKDSGYRRFRVLSADGSVRWLAGSIVCHQDDDGALRLVCMSHDVTREKLLEDEREQLQAQIRRIQALESLGVLAGGIAHDFNNLLSGIMGNAELALAELEASSPARGAAESILAATERAAELVQRMLSLSGRTTLHQTRLDLSAVVAETVQLFRAALPPQILLSCETEAPPGTILGDRSQISQLVLNLITNATEAIGAGPGTIRVTTGALESGERYEPRGSLTGQVKAGRYAWLRVADTGCGIDASIVERIFEPFFTTKFAGRGLGLASVLGIVRAHRGAIDLATKPEQGSEFTVLIPANS